MRINALDHVNIRTRDLDGAARFYSELLGLEVGAAPSMSAEVRWMYDHGGRPIIHLLEFDCEPGSTGPIHHVALDCSGKTEMIERLEKRGAPFDVHENEAAGFTQIFTHDPHGVLLELNFKGD